MASSTEGLDRAIGRIEGRLDGIDREIKGLREDVKAISVTRAREYAGLLDRVNAIDASRAEREGQALAEERSETHSHSWRQTITAAVVACLTAVVTAVATVFAARH